MPKLIRMYRSAELSYDGKFRFALHRAWGAVAKPTCYFIMLNPSTADHMVDDPTIRRCINFAKREHSSLTVWNLFNYRATNPKELADLSLAQRLGEPSYDLLARIEAVRSIDTIVVAWGSSPYVGIRAEFILRTVRKPLMCLGQNKDGSPKHPLYIPADQPFVPFEH